MSCFWGHKWERWSEPFEIKGGYRDSEVSRAQERRCARCGKTEQQYVGKPKVTQPRMDKS